jgi:hypothetical protein
MYRVTRSSFPPYKDLVLHMMDNVVSAQGRDNSVLLGDNDPNRAGKSAKDFLSDYIEALIMHISTEATSQRGGPPSGKSHTELVMLVPTSWLHILKSRILKVCFSPI